MEFSFIKQTEFRKTEFVSQVPMRHNTGKMAQH